VSGLPGELRVVDDLPGAFAEAIAEAFQEHAGTRFSLFLSGGPTARRCYERLATRSDIDWRRVDAYMGDERCVPPDDPDANQRLVREALLEHVGPIGSFHPMSCDEGARAYGEELRDVATDVIHLGLGPDGHTASLFPDSPALHSPPGFLAVRSADPRGNNPLPRMTLTYEAIARARLVVFTVSGAAKRAALAAVRAGADLPAARVRAARVLWLADRDAGGARLP
jgi:6-phosphogluconolactonase